MEADYNDMNYNISEYIIRAYISDGETFINGKKDFEEGKVINTKIVDLDNKAISADVDGRHGKKYSVKVFFDGGGNILKTMCTCCKNKCRHTSAVLFKIVNSSTVEKNKNLNNSENCIFKRLSEDFKKQNFFYNNLKIKKRISIYPVLKLTDDNRLSVGFVVGDKVRYIIDNIFDFFKKVKNNEDYYINKNTFFKVSELKKEAFEYIDFIERQILDFTDFFDNEEFFSGGNFVLSKRGTDDFFDITQWKEVIWEHFPNKVLFSDEEIDFHIRLEKYDDKFLLYGKNMRFKFIEGLAFGYILSENVFYRVDKKKFDIIKKVNDAFFMTEDNKIVFFQNDIAEFVNYIVPVFEKNNILENIKDIYGVLGVSEPKAEFYIESDGKDIFLEVKYIYENSLYFEGILRNKIESLIFDMGFEYEFDDNYRMENDEDIFQFYYTRVEELKNFGEIFLSESFERGKVKAYKNVLGGIRISGGFLEIDFDLKDFDFNELQEILNAYKIKKRFFRMRDGAFIDLTKSDLDPMFDIIEGFDLTRKDLEEKNKLLMPVYNVLYLNEIITKGNYKIKTDSVYDEIIERFKGAKNRFEAPKELEPVLRDYQKKGFFWLKALSSLNFGGILADDMGLGKTIQIISVILSEEEKKPSIIICPTSLIYNWESEIKKFAPLMERKVVAGAPDVRKEIILEKNFFGVFITTYDLLKRDIEYYADFNFKFIVADEAQNIKNSFTRNAKTVKTLNGDVKFALTGTPIENSLTEFWSVFDFVMPGYLGSRKKFKTDFENPIAKYNDKSISDKLKRKTMPFILRRIKKDVLKELPEKSEKILYCDMTLEQKRLYTANLIKARMEVDKLISEEGFETRRIKILSYITRLRQLCCHPSLFIGEYEGGSGKLELALETIKNVSENGHRVLLFSQFTSMLNIIKDELNKRKIDFFYLDGSTPSFERTEMSKIFNSGEKDVFLISLKAGGTGLNLTGADVVIHFDPWWNPAVMEQASDRAYRFGQIKNVQVFYLVTKDSVEEKIIVLQEKKKELIKSIISDSGEIIIDKMTKEDIIEIFRE